jgi:hypothetical protein
LSARFAGAEKIVALLLRYADFIYPETIEMIGEGGRRMSTRKAAFVVTHLCAPDPNPRKVKAALEIWQMGLAEQVMAGVAVEERKPIARIEIGPRRRVRKPRVSEGGQHA